MEGQMTIFDYIDAPKAKEKEIGPKCFDCRYQVWLHKGGRGIQACELYGDCHFNMFDFETFRDYCKHQSGSIKFGDDEEASRGCTFKDERSATCWDDWQKCNEQNCPFMKKMKGEL